MSFKLTQCHRQSCYLIGHTWFPICLPLRKPHQIPPLGIRIQPDLRAVGFSRRNVLKCSIPATPPWVFKRPHIDYSIHQSSKDNTAPEIYRNKFFEFCDHYKDFSRLYTDGSRMGNQVAAAVVYRSTTKTTRLPNTASIFSAELYAISLALALIRRSKESSFVIFSVFSCQVCKH